MAQTADTTDTSSPPGALETAEVFAALARSLAELGGVQPTLEEVISRAVDLVPCAWAVAATAHRLGDRRPEHMVGDGDLAELAAEIAQRAGSSPGWEAFRTGSVVYSPDLHAETRFGTYPAEMVARTPVRSVLALGLWLHDKPLGVMTLYGRIPRAFDEEARTRAALLADHATIALDSAAMTDRADTLRAGLDSNRRIGAAVGMLVERHKVTPEQAFDMLRLVSQRTNRRLLDLAEELVQSGQVG